MKISQSRDIPATSNRPHTYTLDPEKRQDREKRNQWAVSAADVEGWMES